MKFKFTSLIFFIFFFTSCTVFKQYYTQEINHKAGKITFLMKSNMPIIEIEMNSKKFPFVFDTGATATIVQDTLMVENFHKSAKGSLSAKGVNGVKVEVSTINYPIKTTLFESKNKFLAVKQAEVNNCFTRNFYGILGMDCFINDKLTMQINFSDKTLALIHKDSVNTSDYKEIESSFRDQMIFVNFEINGTKKQFKLDTGFSDFFIIPLNDDPMFNKLDAELYNGSSFKAFDEFSDNNKEIHYKNVEMDFAGEKFVSTVIASSSNKATNVGIRFMKNFDWILDFENKKVFVKRINTENKLNKDFKKYNYITYNSNNQIVIILKNQQLIDYNVGDVITSINGEKVTAKNICEMNIKLNKAVDWGTLQLEIIRAKAL
ncbi:hypothetical protein [Flavobacterium sp. GT3R68]|uniref:hypothetical protein n=1 Tax=Flavobacterium sp. GT3R68 TaxID=2594437 RepID=UPI000F86ED0A|nr:hypothetical protein [Flavobacterium sp. GT3R68]RTY93968.1 hypothetical protein EKL32_13890 [Flavobacterium sp. GSN2]TRW93418.1 hypothetical protein FNW07_00495 [Flavobacterium sp. GT3R68]